MYLNPGSAASIQLKNLEQFSKLKRQGQFHQLLGQIFGQRNRLIALSEIEQVISISGRYDAGVKTVRIGQIIGSYGRSIDFDRYFRPLKKHNQARWTSIAVAREAFINLPVIQLIQIGDHYFVLDGHHRISVARLLGQREMDAAVTVWATTDCLEELIETINGTNHFMRAASLIRYLSQRIRDLGSSLQLAPNGSDYNLQPR